MKRYAFHEARLEGLSIFKVPELLLPVFATDVFVRHVHESGLTGFYFRCVWPPPDPETERRKFLETRARKRKHKKR